jgi:hypothetical protein
LRGVDHQHHPALRSASDQEFIRWVDRPLRQTESMT